MPRSKRTSTKTDKKGARRGSKLLKGTDALSKSSDEMPKAEEEEAAAPPSEPTTARSEGENSSVAIIVETA